METTQTYLKEIFSTAHGAVYQCDKGGSFLVEFAGRSSDFKFPCFFALRTRINQIDLEAMITSSDASSDVEIVCPCGSNRVYVLSSIEVIQFKELLNGAKVMLELNSILYERLYRIPA